MHLSAEQLAALRAVPATVGPNRLRVAFALAEVKQSVVCDTLKQFSPQKLSKLVRGAYVTVSVDDARALAEFFGCAIEDLFPAEQYQAVSA